MNNAQQLHALGQSLWLDNITRELLTSGTLGNSIGKYSVTGLTSRPTIFDNAIRNADLYHDAIRHKALAGKLGEAPIIRLALEDRTLAAEFFSSVHAMIRGADGWVSLEISPLLVDDTPIMYSIRRQ